jgi:hypothetical protein
MATSTNYGWSEPDNTSLVRDGALAIRTLGDAIDTSLWNSGYGQAGKNKIINGDFFVNQRAFTSTTADQTYIFDRYKTRTADGTVTYSAQTFTVGTAPVAGYEGKNYLRIVTSGQTLTSAITNLQQLIESVRTFAGQTTTISFWAKANTGTPKMSVELTQNFGSGGSASVNTYAGQVTLSTSWARYSVTVVVPSISGKTVGTSDCLELKLFVSAGSDFNARTGSLGIQSNTFEIWGVQAEYGSKATPFQTASGGSIQNELAMCQRYYWRSTAGNVYQAFGTGQAFSTTAAIVTITNPVPMRIAPASIDFSTIGATTALASVNAATLTLNHAGVISSNVNISTTGLVVGDAVIMLANNSTSAYIAMNAEL